jgi:hypothetical protein
MASATGIFDQVLGLSLSADKSLAVTYTTASVFVRAAYPGDTDFSGTVDFDDLLKLAQNYGLGGKTWVEGDFSGNGAVDFDDLLTLAQKYGQSIPALNLAGLNASFAADWALAQSLVPEPTSLAALGLVAGGVMTRRRRVAR